MDKKKLVIAIVALVLLLIGLGAGLFLVRQQQDIREKAAPATSISFKPPTKSILAGESFDVTIEASTGTNILAAADLEVNYDPQKLSLVSFTTGTFLPTVLTPASVNNTGGSATITLGAQVSNPPQGTGTLATLKFKALTAGNASLSFGPKTRAAGTNESDDLIVSKSPTTITVIATDGQLAGTGSNPTTAPTAAPGTSAPTTAPTTAPIGGTGATAPPAATASPATGATAAPSASAKPTVTLPANKTVKAGDTISGTAKPNSTVTITIQSDPITTTVKADSAGKWSYTLPSSLAAGSHTITVTDSNGTYTTTFTVSGSSGTVSTPSGSTPEAGFSAPTFVALGAGLLLVIFGFILAF